MGFPMKWIKWIRECLTSAWISILVNGAPTEEFQMQKGVRQGDPLSPFLFIIAAEGLNWSFKKMEAQGLIQGMQFGNGGPKLTHLQFADDTLVFCKADLVNVTNIRRVLRAFEITSGLKINYHKTMLCGVCVNDAELQTYAEVLRCKTQKLPIKYLGMPLGVSPRLKSTWKEVITKVRLRLASWKRRYLSFEGRIVLIKSVLGSLPIFYMSLFKMPESVARSIESIQARFLWGGSDLKKKIHLVAWSKVTQPYSSGGLGIKNIRDMNDALLTKWWWRYGNEKQALWRKIINFKYKGVGNGWSPNMEITHRVSTLWRGIMKKLYALFVGIIWNLLTICCCTVNQFWTCGRIQSSGGVFNG